MYRISRENAKAVARLETKAERMLAELLLRVMNCPEMSEEDISAEGQKAFMDGADYLATKGIIT